MKDGIRKICADFRGDRMYLCGRAFPVGSLAMMLLEEGYINDALLHVTVFRTNAEDILKSLSADYVESDVLLKMGEDIQIMLGALRSLSPYRWMDIDGEAEYVRSLCSEDTASKIEEYLVECARLRSMNRAELYIRNKFNLPSSPENMEGCELLDEVRRTAEFYLRLSDDLASADYSLRNFMRKKKELEKLDESHLLTLALDVFRIPDFDVHTEYVAVDGKSGKKAVARRLYFDSYYSLFMTDFFEGIRCAHRAEKCQVCGRYFMMGCSRRQKYCDGYAPEELTGKKKKSCRKWAASKKSGLAKEKAAADPVKAAYTTRCSVIREYKSRGTISDEFAAAALRIAKEYRDRALQDTDYANSRYYDDISHENIMSETANSMRKDGADWKTQQ